MKFDDRMVTDIAIDRLRRSSIAARLECDTFVLFRRY